MDQEEKMDFKALRARFQDKDVLLKQPRIKPTLPEKPKVPPPPPPQSPTHYLPAGARPSLLTSINQTLESKTVAAPRVVFKEKEESKKPLLPTKKDKSEGKLKKGKDKLTKGSKEKLDEEPKQKNDKDKKGSTAELVAATPPPKATTGKKGFLGFRKAKRDSALIQADSILDAPTSGDPGQAPLIPVPPDSGDTKPEQETSPSRALLPIMPTIPDAALPVEIAPPSSIPDSPAFTPPPAFIPDNPTPVAPTPVSETTLPEETPSLPVFIPPLQSETPPSPPSTLSTPPPSPNVSSPPTVGFTSSPAPPEPAAEAVSIDGVEVPPPVLDPPSIQSSPKAARPISALSALERAEDMSPGKRTPPCDLRIVTALEKARRKTTSQQNTPSTSYSTLPSGDLSPLNQSPTSSVPELPPIDYENRMRNTSPIPAEMNGSEHGQSFPALNDITEGGTYAIPEMFVVPPPPPMKFLTDPDSVSAAPEKPAQPPSHDLRHILPPQPDDNDIPPPPPQFSETSSADIPVFDYLGSEAQTPELPGSDWGSGDCTHLDTPDGQNTPDHFSNGLFTLAAEVPNQHAPLPESSFSTSQASSPQPGLQDQDYNGISESTDTVSEEVSKFKKKGKTDGGKKRKGPPKNPYVETPLESNEEKSKTGRFGKNDKKAEGPDEKELKKKEKQRLEKEKKELKEKQERERKEQKEREKRENEMKKTFKITGQEETLYQATALVTAKGRKHDLPVKKGDHISIIRTTNCPKGKWLSRDSGNNYGYVSVEYVELDIKEMLELGKKVAKRQKSASSTTEMDNAGKRMSNHVPLSDSFTDDSEEWTGDEEELHSPHPQSEDHLTSISHTRTLSMPDMGNKDLSINHQHSHSDMGADNSNVQARQEALQKLATFFYPTKPVEPAASTESKTSPVLVMEEAVGLPGVSSSEEKGLNESESDMILLPPPELYADLTEE
ncbi:FYN-binding protein 1 isoform X1 [Takifugu rubripes]|uniref:FYN-binding protein 1 isoform X1 n=1 Tax=Takifugu rubripes TaxID=31033 RepID=UPI001145E02B|nr:FYN-binding protein 1-like isoform X1 [Takifugu rubripes]